MSAHEALGRQFHGTSARLKPGDVIEPGKGSASRGDSSGEHVYFTPHLDVAASYAESQAGWDDRGRFQRGRVYHVEPLGDVEPDPNMPRYGQRARKAKVVKEVPYDDTPYKS